MSPKFPPIKIPRYERGVVVAIQLPKSQKWVVGVVAHRYDSRSRNRFIILYAFGGPHDQMPTAEQAMSVIVPEKIVWVCLTTEVFVKSGAWPIIGQVPEGVLRQWPLLPQAQYGGNGYDKLAHGPFSLANPGQRLFPPVKDLGKITPQEAANWPESLCYGALLVPEVLEMAVEQGWKGRRPIPGYEHVRVDILRAFPFPESPLTESGE